MGADDMTETARHLNSAAIHLLRGLHRVDAESGLTSARLSALSVLVFGGPTTLGDLAAAEDVSSPTMTRIVDALVELGMATRVQHPDSGRKVLLRATTAGTRLMEAAAQRRFAEIVAALRQLDETEVDAVTAAAPALRRLSAVVSSRAVRPSGVVS